MTSPNGPGPLATILIVEDEFLIASDLRRIVSKAGYQVLGLAESAAEARTLVAAQPPAIVLLDIFLQGEETGIQLANWLNELAIPFVFLSANLTGSVLEEAKVTQPLGVLNKPFHEKDVLTTLEIARYRHAHSTEAKLRRQQEMQMAVNNAIVSIQDREELCRAIAQQLVRLVPFTLFHLHISLPDAPASYSLLLATEPDGNFARISLRSLLPDDASADHWQEQVPPAASPLGEQPGIFTGQAFEELCAQYVMARVLHRQFGVQALALFPVLLKRRSSISIQLAGSESDSFGPKEYETVSLVMPQIALALDNLLVSEEVEARRRTKTAELAVVNAFQKGPGLAEIMPQVALAIRELLPIEGLYFYQPEQGPGGGPLGIALQREAGRFVPLAASPSAWQPVVVAPELWPQEPALYVGPPADETLGPIARLDRERPELNSALYVPLFNQEELMGALVVASRRAYAFTAKDLLVFQDLSRQFALALGNLLAFERSRALSQQLEQEKIYLKEELKTSHNFEEIIGASPALQAVFHGIAQVAPTDYTVLVLGETGTGKELIARALHNLSPRRARTMVKLNCAALPPQLIESELFGHEKGSYTGATDKRLGKFELAHGSTLFLDEIGELPLVLQAKLLRVLQEKEIERIGGRTTIAVDVRIVAATNRNLHQEVAAGRFRADLYYRLNVFPLTVPALRERPEDILLLTTFFLQKIAKQLGKPLTGITQASMQQLQRYAWPGNVRELEHVLERAAILSRTPTVELTEPLTSTGLPTPPKSAAGAPAQEVRPIQDTMREAILAALAQANNRIRGKEGAAELLNLKPTTLEARMKKLRIRLRPEGPTPD